MTQISADIQGRLLLQKLDPIARGFTVQGVQLGRIALAPRKQVSLFPTEPAGFPRLLTPAPP
jgi:hypothetical protein